MPSVTNEERRNYTKFRKHLLKSGFMMLQESVYCKLVLNQTVMEGVLKSLKKNKPPEGNIMILNVTEKQFSKMEFIIGNKKSDVLDNTERLIIL